MCSRSGRASGPSELRRRFVAITRVGDVITCRAQVAEHFSEADEPRIRLTLTASDQQGQVKVQGEAVLAVPAH